MKFRANEGVCQCLAENLGRNSEAGQNEVASSRRKQEEVPMVCLFMHVGHKGTNIFHMAVNLKARGGSRGKERSVAWRAPQEPNSYDRGLYELLIVLPLSDCACKQLQSSLKTESKKFCAKPQRYCRNLVPVMAPSHFGRG